MSQRKHTPEQIINKLREAEVALAKGATVAQVCKKLGVSDHTYPPSEPTKPTAESAYRWRSEYGGMRVDQAKRLKELEKENARLKKLVAEQALDISILKEAAAGNF